MAKIVTITNPLTGQPAQVDQLDHTAQQIDDGLNIARGVSNPNLLDNWYFGNPVNQRGQTSYTDAGNTIDRWKLRLWQSTSPSLTISDGYITLSNNTAEGTPCSCNIQQIIDNPERFAGQTVTFSVLLGAVAKGSGRLVIAISVNGSAGTATEIQAENANSIASITLTLPSEVTSLNVYIGQYASNVGKGTFSIQLKAAKLELGTHQTLAHQDDTGNWVLNEIPDYGEQLARCQRYFYRVIAPYDSDYSTVGSGLCTSTYADIIIPLPKQMRNKPTVTISNMSDLRLQTSSNDVAPTAISVLNMSSAAITLRANCTGLTSGAAVIAYLRNRGYIDFTSDL